MKLDTRRNKNVIGLKGTKVYLFHSTVSFPGLKEKEI